MGRGAGGSGGAAVRPGVPGAAGGGPPVAALSGAGQVKQQQHEWHDTEVKAVLEHGAPLTELHSHWWETGGGDAPAIICHTDSSGSCSLLVRMARWMGWGFMGHGWLQCPPPFTAVSY